MTSNLSSRHQLMSQPLPALVARVIAAVLLLSSTLLAARPGAAVTYATSVAEIQWRRPADANYQSAGGTLNVLKGTRLIFKAIPNPSGTAWPANSPTWSGSASGTGETKDITFNTLSTSLSDYKTVTAKVANEIPAIINVIVYELTPGTEAVEFFTNRSETRYGVGEEVNLIYTTSPAGIMVNIDWRHYSGLGAVSGAVFTAGTSGGSATVRAWVADGPSQSEYRDISRTVVAPNDAYMGQAPGTNIRHINGYISVGFLGHIWLEPRDVSFSKIEFREGTVNAVASGCWAFENGNAHPVGSWITVLGGNSTTGCRVNGVDTVQAADVPPPFTSGDFVWDIPWEYRVGTGNATYFTTARHHQWADAAPNLGRAHISKNGAGPFTRDAADPTSTY